MPLEGHFVRRAWLLRCGSEALKQPFALVLQSWDTASKAGELNDFSVCTTWGVRDRRYHLLDVVRQRLEFPDLKRAVHERAVRFRPGIILIEDKASGTQLIQELRREGLPAVRGVQPPPGADKVMRLHAHTATFESGRVLLLETAPWLDSYIDEITGFPAVRYADQVDSTTQALAYLDDNCPAPLIITDEVLRRASQFFPSRRVLP